MTERDRMDNLHRAFRLRGFARGIDELRPDFEAARIPLISDLEDIRRRIFTLADLVEALQC